MENQFDRELEDRLLQYAAIDSQSDNDATIGPSTAVQFNMLNLLKQ